ncbi:ribosomal protein L7/L12 [uncultured Gimesia sp.]|uniref:ribosomal protein L7/L12 n=1 Tax=uncultured Gimesia sp. TaxID=1678688 RepID=UPI0030DC99F3|tara:strand:- start:34934 stop:35209 length:276 start_codon:yes stop_codon:yes gene_type:complete
MNDSDSQSPEDTGAADDQSELVRKIVNSLKQGNKIQAIKDYRESTGAGLKESKEVIDELIQKYEIQMKSGCASMVLMTLSTLLVLFVFCGR